MKVAKYETESRPESFRFKHAETVHQNQCTLTGIYRDDIVDVLETTMFSENVSPGKLNIRIGGHVAHGCNHARLEIVDETFSEERIITEIDQVGDAGTVKSDQA